MMEEDVRLPGFVSPMPIFLLMVSLKQIRGKKV